MKRTYSAPIVEIIILNSTMNVMDDAPVNPFSDKTETYDSNSTSMDLEDDEDFLRPSRSLWE